MIVQFDMVNLCLPPYRLWNLTEAERKRFREQFLYAEQELAAAKGREQSLQGQLLKEVNDSKERFKKQIQSYSELEVQSLFLLQSTEVLQHNICIECREFSHRNSKNGQHIFCLSQVLYG